MDVIARDGALMHCLACVRDLALPDAYVAAGAIRSSYFRARHARGDQHVSDVDVVYFDPERPRSYDAWLERLLHDRAPDVRWEVTNQAHVHTWYEAYAGHALEPLRSTRDGIAMWPETATCIGARLLPGGQIEILAPLGLEDLFALRWRANPRCPDSDAYKRRFVEKQISRAFPLVTLGDETL